MNSPRNSLPVLQIEICHGIILFGLTAFSSITGALEPKDLLLGGLLMGINFILLSLGIQWTVSPRSTRKRVRAGAILLGLKLLLLLGLISAVFIRVDIDGISFGVGVTSFLAATMLVKLFTGPKEITLES